MVWLTGFCLIGLGVMVTIKLGRPTSPPSTGASPEQTTIGKDLHDTLTKADKLEIPYLRDRVAIEPVMLVTKARDEILPQPPSSTASPKIVSRHWHDPNAKESAAVSLDRRIKGQEPKKSKNVDHGKATVDLRISGRVDAQMALRVC
jgi:hypothetical protein